MRVLIDEDRIRLRVLSIAGAVQREFRGKPLTVVGVLTGSLVFLADLIRRIEIPLKVGLVQASSYRGASTQAGTLHIQDELLPDLRGRHILLIDDILDTGRTLRGLVDRLHRLGTASVRTAVLLRKEGRQEVEIEPDFVGFTIPNAFVVGYGLDYDDEYRNLPHIAVLDGPK